jgi:hypothetical protein
MAPFALAHSHTGRKPKKMLLTFLTPPLKFHFASNSGFPAEREGFCFALIFFGYFFVSRQKSNWGLRGNAPEKTALQATPPIPRPHTGHDLLFTVHQCSQKKSPFRTEPLARWPGKTAGPGCCECRKAVSVRARASLNAEEVVAF